jgi:hypothetical protein
MTAVFDILPGWVYAAIIAALLLVGGGAITVQTVRLADAQAEVAGFKLAVQKQKTAAAQTLAAETNKVLDLERQLGAARAAQEENDADNAQTVAALREGLRAKSRAAGGPGLRDPFAARCGGGGGGAPVAAAAGADRGAADAAEAAGLVSQPLEDLLLELADAGDAINNAYISCRADSQAVRGKGAPSN